MKKLTLAIAGLLLAASTFAAPCDGKDKGSASCCKGKKEACAKKSGKGDCSKKNNATAKK